ncbi:MAG: hypothetical protein HQK50_14100 [Oligoflexia bacterium]|nr:hypothetical protein [Oligoflexia bacterium]
MSEIDGCKHKCIGLIKCDFDRAYFPNPAHKETMIPIYKLMEASDFGENGDIIIGDGSGGVPMFRLSTSKIIRFISSSDFNVDDTEDMFKTYWSATAAYVLCDGFKKFGWDYRVINIEMWISTHIVAFLKREYFEDYKDHFGDEKLDYDGSICRIPNDDEELSL